MFCFNWVGSLHLDAWVVICFVFFILGYHGWTGPREGEDTHMITPCSDLDIFAFLLLERFVWEGWSSYWDYEHRALRFFVCRLFDRGGGGNNHDT